MSEIVFFENKFVESVFSMTVIFLDPMFILNTEIALGFADVNTEMEAKGNKFAIEQIYKIVFLLYLKEKIWTN